MTKKLYQHLVNILCCGNINEECLSADDIPIQDVNQSAQTDTPLDSITEEQDDPDKMKTKAVSALKHLPKLPGLTKKHKTKNNPQGDPPLELQVNNSEMNDSLANEINHAVHISAV